MNIRKSLKSVIVTAKMSARVFKYQVSNFPTLTVSMLAVCSFVAASGFFESKMTELVINNLLSPGAIGTGFLITLFVIAYSLPSFLRNIKDFIDRKYFFAIQEKLSLSIMRKRLDVDIATHEKSTFQTLLSKVNDRDIWPIANIGDRLFIFFQNSVEITLAVIITVSFDWRFFIVILVGSLPKFIIEILYGDRVWGIWDAEANIRKRFWNLKNLLQEKNDVVELKLYQSGDFVWKWISNLYSSFTKKQLVAEYQKIYLHTGAVVISACSYGFILYSLFEQVSSGKLLVGSLVFIFASVRSFESALSDILTNIGKQYKDSLFAEDIFKFLDTSPIIKNTGKIILPDTETPPRIEFRNVSFAYENAKENVLTDINFTIEPGEKIALVGINGAGKTTLVKLLTRIYDPVKGEILINGTNLKEININSWWSKLGILFQDFSSYQFSVKDSIAMGNVNIAKSEHKIKDAARASEASDFIEKWTDTYEHMIGNDFEGTEPSKGQKQKLALARVWYRDARILILDEPTSAVDAQSEQKIFEKIENLPKTTSAILISHRFSTVRHADTIYVISNGSILEKGSHEELVQKKGEYSKLFEMQKKGYEN